MDPQRTHLDRLDIEEILPHRRPFLFLETAEVVEPGALAIGQLADLTHPDFDFLHGHFPDFRVVPGAIIMETLAELAGIAAQEILKVHQDKKGFLAADNMRYRRVVRPGEPLQLEARVNTVRRNFVFCDVAAFKGDKRAADGHITFILLSPEDIA